MMKLPDHGASALWVLLLTAASTITTLALACATPFPALAALAATQMRARDGVALILVAWAASQAVGFGLLGYPHDPRTLLWGAALGLAAVASVGAARATLPLAQPGAARLVAAFLLAGLAFKAVVALAALALGGLDIALSPAVAARQFVRDGAVLVALLLLYRGLVSAGLPPAPRRHAALA